MFAWTNKELLLDSSAATMNSSHRHKEQEYPPDLSDDRLIDLVSQIKVGRRNPGGRSQADDDAGLANQSWLAAQTGPVRH